MKRLISLLFVAAVLMLAHTDSANAQTKPTTDTTESTSKGTKKQNTTRSSGRARASTPSRAQRKAAARKAAKQRAAARSVKPSENGETSKTTSKRRAASPSRSVDTKESVSSTSRKTSSRSTTARRRTPSTRKSQRASASRSNANTSQTTNQAKGSLSTAGTISRPQESRTKGKGRSTASTTTARRAAARKTAAAKNNSNTQTLNAAGASASSRKTAQSASGGSTSRQRKTRSDVRSAGRKTSQRAVEELKYPRFERTKAGTLEINNASQEIGEIIREDRQEGYVAYTNPAGLLLQRFTKEGIARIRAQYGDEVADRVEEANDGSGKRLFDRGLDLEADLQRLGVDPEKAREAARNFVSNPSPKTDPRKTKEKAVIDALDLPKELYGRGWSPKDLVNLAGDFQVLGGDDAKKQITPEFFNEWAKVRNKNSKERAKFVRKWGEQGKLTGSGRLRSRPKKSKDRGGQSKVRTPGRGGSGTGGRRVSSSGGSGSGAIGGRSSSSGGASSGGSGSSSGNTGPGSGPGIHSPGGIAGPGPGGGSIVSPKQGGGGGSRPQQGTGSSGGSSGGAGASTGTGSRGGAGDSTPGGRTKFHAEISNSTTHADGSYSYNFSVQDSSGNVISSGRTYCNSGRCVDYYDNGQTQTYDDNVGSAPDDGDHDFYSSTGKTAGPGEGPNKGGRVLKAGEVHKKLSRNEQLTNVRPENRRTRVKPKVTLDPNESRINIRPELAGGSKNSPPSQNTVSPTEQRINVRPELSNPKNPEAGSGRPTGTRMKKDSKTRKKSTASKKRTKQRARQRKQRRTGPSAGR